MNAQNFQSYLIPALIIGFFAWRFLKNRRIQALIPQYLNQGAIIIDVRTKSEFNHAHARDSKNIPLNEIDVRYKELPTDKPILLCCASGARSGVAVGILKKNGFTNVINAGPWTNTTKP